MKRTLFLTLVWFMGVAACVCFGVPIFGLVWEHAHGGWAHGGLPEWQHRVGNNQYVWGITGSGMYVARLQTPTDQVPQSANETGVASTNQYLREVSFMIGRWSHSFRGVYFSPRPNDTWDPQKISQYRFAIDYDKKLIVLDTWRCALLLSVLPAVVLARATHRFILRRRRFLLNHCRACGYDLRASQERCPECGTAIPESANDR